MIYGPVHNYGLVAYLIIVSFNNYPINLVLTIYHVCFAQLFIYFIISVNFLGPLIR